MNGSSRLIAIGGLGRCLWVVCFAVGLAANWFTPASRADEATGEATLDDAPQSESKAETAFTTQTLRGRVVWLSEALDRQYDIRTTRDARERVLALVSESGELFPLIEDRRGRSFRKDQRLRDREVELFVRQYEGVPMIQVIRHYAIKPDGKYIVDYWCDICAISMVEDGPCDCCQAPNVLRERKVE